MKASSLAAPIPVRLIALFLAAILLLVTGCSRKGGEEPAETATASPLTLVESVPVETVLDHPDVPDAYQVWPEMIASAETSLDLAAFYISNEDGSRMEPVLAEIEKAGERGVAVRVMADKGFYRTYPASLDRLAGAAGVNVRLLDFRAVAGGPLHAKYFIVDGREAFVGSQNFDWRALEHIHETGLRIDLPAYARDLRRVFDLDWSRARAIGDTTAVAPPRATASVRPSDEEEVEAERPALRTAPYRWVEAGGDTACAWPAFSPRGELPDESTWDLPLILGALDAARDSIHVTVLTYSPVSRDTTYWPPLDVALRRAAVRGVKVRLLVADWSKRHPAIDHLKSLQVIPGIDVRLVTIPRASAGFIPFARVTHAKYLTVDGGECWLGTSNWSKGYFTTTRNVGLVVRGREITAALDRDFNTLWSSPYAYEVRPEAVYEAPRIGP